MISKEIYKIFCSYIVNSNDDLHLGEDSYGHEYEITYEKDICGVSINITSLKLIINKYESVKIKIDIILEFEEFYNKQVFETMIALNKIYPPHKESSALLLIADNEFNNYKQLPLRIVFREIFTHIFRSLAVNGRAARFYEDFINGKYPYNVKMKVVDNEVDFGDLHLNFGTINIRRLLLNKNQIKNIVNVSNNYQSFVLLSDMRLNNGDFRGAITNLTTAMEVAAYEFAKKIGQAKNERNNFSPVKYFTTKKDGDRNFNKIIKYIKTNNAISESTFLILDALWNTRHEIVHNGNLLFRDSCGNKRDINYDDYYNFRSALSAVLVWMGLDSIE